MSYLPYIVDIKRHSLEDGPGIRTVVFFKGCSLRCIFCHNPEAQNPGVEIGFFAGDCIYCGRCKDTCTQGAVDLELPGRIHRDRCILCGKCAGVCPGNGLKLIGARYPVETLSEILQRDLPFYRHSGGGVTLSGGECALYPDYLDTLLRSLKKKAIHIVLETSGHFNYESFKQKILPYLDLIYYDIKIADTEAHKRYVGKSNRLILDNLCRLLEEKCVDVIPRIPLVPGITATEENLSTIVDFLYHIKVGNVHLLPYNPMGIDKAISIGRPKPSLPERFMRPDEEKEVYRMFRTIIEDRRKRSAA